MAFNSGNTYDNAVRREDVSDLVYDLSPQEGFLLKTLGKTKATNTYHEWVVDTLDAPADNAKIEGFDFVGNTINQPTRKGNITQIFAQEVKVSGTDRAVQHYGITDPMDYQKAKKAKVLANEMELAVLRGTVNSGNATNLARRMRGLIASITTNATTQASAQTLNENILGDGIESVYRSGGNVDYVLAGIRLKRQMSKFTTNGTRFVDSKDKTLNSTIEIYMSDASEKPVKLVSHRFMPGAHTGDGTDGMVIGFDSTQFGLSQLRSPGVEDVSKVGDSERAMIVAEVTLEDRNQAAAFKIGNLHYATF